MQSRAKPLNILYTFTLDKRLVREKVIQLYRIILNNRNPETGHESISRSQKYTMLYTMQSYAKPLNNLYLFTLDKRLVREKVIQLCNLPVYQESRNRSRIDFPVAK